MPSEKERIDRLEKTVQKLLEISELNKRQAEIKKGVELVIKEQNRNTVKFSKDIEQFIKGQNRNPLKYAHDVFKAAVILSLFYGGGSKVLDLPWVQTWLKY